MKNIAILLVITILLLAALLSWIFLRSNLSDTGQKEQKEADTNLNEIVTQPSVQTSEEGNVTVRVQPEILSAGEKVVLKLNLDTHSVELDFPIADESTLVDNLGNTLKPISWTGGKGGHHLSGELTFSQLDQNAKTVELVIKDIAGSDRKFRWDL